MEPIKLSDLYAKRNIPTAIGMGAVIQEPSGRRYLISIYGDWIRLVGLPEGAVCGLQWQAVKGNVLSDITRKAMNIVDDDIYLGQFGDVYPSDGSKPKLLNVTVKDIYEPKPQRGLRVGDALECGGHKWVIIKDVGDHAINLMFTQTNAIVGGHWTHCKDFDCISADEIAGMIRPRTLGEWYLIGAFDEVFTMRCGCEGDVAKGGE